MGDSNYQENQQDHNDRLIPMLDRHAMSYSMIFS